MTGDHREQVVWSPATVAAAAGGSIAVNAAVFAVAFLAGWWPPGGPLAAAFAVVALSLFSWASGHRAGSRTELRPGPRWEP
jgi:hypothetical protein